MHYAHVAAVHSYHNPTTARHAVQPVAPPIETVRSGVTVNIFS